MLLTKRSIVSALSVFTFNMIMPLSAHAHLMVAQHGTLNIVEDNVYMVLSLPISAFNNLDDDKNGEISMLEFNMHRSAIVESVKNNIVLSDQNGERPLKGFILSPVSSHDGTNQTLSQVTVMGRFTLDQKEDVLSFATKLFGNEKSEQVLEITATRRSDHKKQIVELTPDANSIDFFVNNLN
ncbi:MAG: hypothetical protein NWQ54_12990 [Paraglaciecola sp.]|uniref:hypothetical protein n=1 Tax=Paraglaciecola sp. TaxID=1920173 RepID=UPI00273DEC4C|nr:hypothetical protein [Paraglaciecola sp.]MDP5030382.1 hypothetical protein [Paraglaciecola sp.]MDP5041044.1 hypothetical protein [Paraglaciecola sp.]MDP5131795.1 hypothetical protein [Paraglaciecola sp.]